MYPRVARCLKLKNAKLCFKKRKIFDFTIINFYKLKKGQLLNIIKNYEANQFKKRTNLFFGLEKAKPGNSGVPCNPLSLECNKESVWTRNVGISALAMVKELHFAMMRIIPEAIPPELGSLHIYILRDN